MASVEKDVRFRGRLISLIEMIPDTINRVPTPGNQCFTENEWKYVGGTSFMTSAVQGIRKILEFVRKKSDAVTLRHWKFEILRFLFLSIRISQ